MSVSTITWKLEANGDGSTTTFLCAFPIMRLADLKVYVDDVLQTYARDYTVTGLVTNERNHIDAGFSVVFTVAPALDADIYIRRQTPRHNSNKLYSGDEFQLPVFENNYDNLVMIFQEIGGLILEGYQGPISENAPPDNYFPVHSGFYPAKIVGNPSFASYTIRSVVPNGNGWSEVSFPILDQAAADINQRSDLALGDIVLALPVDNTVGNVSWRFVANETCGDTAFD